MLRGLIAALWVVCGAASACSAPTNANVCSEAATRVSECTGVEVAAPTSCTASEAAEAERVLSSTCSEISDIGKADFDFKCSWIGRQLGACNFIPDDGDVLTSIGTAAAPSFDDRELELLVWNVYKGSRDDWDDDMRALARGVDLAMVQEFFLDTDSTATFEATSPLAWSFATSFRQGAADGPRTGVATGAVVEPRDVEFLRSEAREPIANTPKMAIVTSFDLAFSEQDLMVVNVHAINFTTTGDFEAQVTQIEDRIATHSGPAIVAGDFNTWWPSRHTALEDAMARQGFEYIPLAEDMRGLLQLDHVFVRGMSVSSPRLVNHVESSDHTPIRMRLRIDG